MKYISFILSLCFCLGISAQTKDDLSQAKIYYKNGEFAKALPILERERSTRPTDPSLNLLLGSTIYETGGNKTVAEEYLLIASKRNLPESYLYLGDIYTEDYRITEARTLYDRYAKARPKEKETTLAERYEGLEKMRRAISRTEDIQIIDSLIVNKNNFLSAYRLSAEGGSLAAFNEIFETNKKIESTVYINGKNSKIYFGQPSGDKISLFSMDKLLNGYGNEKKVSNNNLGLTGSTNYPFVLTDGVTIYFAGEDENGLGGYDIYVTRYNLNNDSYLTPELLNMPFNSTANDYLYVYDEEKGLGWFATDRFQPEGLICVYTFIPNQEIKLVETEDEIYKENRARLSSIKDTWRQGKNYSELITKAKKTTIIEEKKEIDFSFVINDKYTYNSYSDFKNTTARNLYFEANEKRKTMASVETDLDNKRTEYISSSASQRTSLENLIENLEIKQSQLYDEITELDIRARNEEIKNLK